MIVDKNTFWEENHFKHPALTDKMIAQAENTLGVKLPALLIDLLRVQNGGYTSGFVYPVKKRISWYENHVPVGELYGIVTDSRMNTTQNMLASAHISQKWGLPEKQVVLSGEGDGQRWVTLDYRQGDNPTVTLVDLESGEDVQIAKSFEEFYKGLVSQEDYDSE